jgi:hypothetical protein
MQRNRLRASGVGYQNRKAFTGEELINPLLAGLIKLFTSMIVVLAQLLEAEDADRPRLSSSLSDRWL